MSKMSEMSLCIEELRTASAAIISVADWLAEQFGESEAEEAPILPKPELTLEQVRAALAANSRAGHAAEIRALLQKYGAEKLSQIDPENYEALMRDAEVLDDAEMEDCTSEYVSYIMELLAEVKKTCSDHIVLVEQRLDFSKYVPDGFGTGDCLIVGESDFACGDWCMLCKVKTTCRARAEANLELAKLEFKQPPIPTDESTVADAVTTAGYNPYEKKLLGITAMTSLLGKSKFNEILGELTYKPQGKPTLVPESDKRPAMTTIIEDFEEEI